MTWRKILLIIGVVVFFLTGLTFYLNRVLFPQLIKKIAIEKIQESLKRKVEINSIHFNWFKGFIIDRIKIYEKNSDQDVWAQADRVSFGILLFPGLKHLKITIPFINISSPSVHLVRFGEDHWNFTDLYPDPGAAVHAASAPAPIPKGPSPEISWGGVTISDGQLLVEDRSLPQTWQELFNAINLKLSLTYQGISYDFTAQIPKKMGFVGATVDYQPLTKDTRALIHLKNIDTASYLALIKMPDVQLTSGTIKEINLNMEYAQDKITAQGDVSMKDLDIASRGQTFKGDVDIRSLDVQFNQGDVIAKGQLALAHMQTKVPDFAASGSVEAKVNEFEMTKNSSVFSGSLQGRDIDLQFKNRQVQADAVNIDELKVRRDKDGLQSSGAISTRGLFVQWPSQKLQGDITLKNFDMSMNSADEIALQGELLADDFAFSSAEKSLSSRHLQMPGLRLKVQNQDNIFLETKLSLEDMALAPGNNVQATAEAVKAEKLFVTMNDGTLKVSTSLSSTKGKLVLDRQKSIQADPQLELTLQWPLKAPQKAIYKGSVTLSDAHILGFAPFPLLDNIELDADFQNDDLTINALSVNVLDTNVRVNGSVKDFKRPVLNIIAEADELNLARLKDMAPALTTPLGLDFDGTASVKVQFAGLAADPLAAKILMIASVKDVSASSAKFNQRLDHITGIIEATPDALKWRDFSASYQGQKFTLSGSLSDFKNPKILTTLEGQDLELKADIAKRNDLVTIKTMSGKYMDAAFDTKGTITLAQGQAPAFDLSASASLLLEDLIKKLPAAQRENFTRVNPSGMVSLTADFKGRGADWKNNKAEAQITSPQITLWGYKLTDLKINLHQDDGKLKNATLDAALYSGTVHAVGNMDLVSKDFPYDLALNVDNTDMHLLKMDSPLKMEEINGKFFLTTLAHGSVRDFKKKLQATGSLAIRDGFLAEFNLFKGLLSVLNDALRLGKVEITDVDGNFTIGDQKINTDNLRLKGPTIVLLGKGWVDFDENCDLNMTVDLSSGIVPAIANDVLNTLNIHVYDKITNPKFKKKISVPQVINSLLKNLLQ